MSSDPAYDAKISSLFQTMVAQQANMVLVCLGKVANPESDTANQDLEAARFFIDQLEMLSVKTKGNLSQDEQTALQQTLAGMRLAFVEASNAARKETAKGPNPTQTAPSPSEPQAPAAETATPPASPPPADQPPVAPDSPEESRKKFTKKY